MDEPVTLPPSRPRMGTPRRRERWMAMAIAILLGVGLCLTVIPPEVARWYRAAADEAHLDGDFQRAKAHLNKALRWAGDDPDLLLFRSQMSLKLKEFDQSLRDCNRAVEILGDDATDALLQRLIIHQRMNQHQLALADADRIVESWSKRYTESDLTATVAYADALNTRAYARALSKQGIEAGLADIQLTFELLGTEDNAAYLDTRGYLYFLAGDLENAQRDMERSVQLAEDDRSSLLMQREDMLQNGVDPRRIELQDESLRHSLAVLYHHRGLVNEALGHAEKAAQDFELADEFGYSPEDGVW